MAIIDGPPDKIEREAVGFHAETQSVQARKRDAGQAVYGAVSLL